MKNYDIYGLTTETQRDNKNSMKYPGVLCRVLLLPLLREENPGAPCRVYCCRHSGRKIPEHPVEFYCCRHSGRNINEKKNEKLYRSSDKNKKLRQSGLGQSQYFAYRRGNQRQRFNIIKLLSDFPYKQIFIIRGGGRVKMCGEERVWRTGG